MWIIWVLPSIFIFQDTCIIFVGADIENLVNQAAIRAAVDQAESVTMKYLENARDKVLMGELL